MTIIKDKLMAMCLLALPLLAAADDAALKQAEASARVLFPGEQGYKVLATPVPGLYEIEFTDGFVYITSDGKYAVKGEIIDVQRNVSLTEEKRSLSRLRILDKVADREMLAFTPKDKQYTHTINVFTDIDCSYCRRMHSEMDEYLKRGIRVRYLFYPRAGKNSVSYNKAVAVWCNNDRHEAMTRAKQGANLANKQCANPVDKHMQIADELGVNATPTIILDDGGRLPGYIPAERLLPELQIRKQAAQAAHN